MLWCFDKLSDYHVLQYVCNNIFFYYIQTLIKFNNTLCYSCYFMSELKCQVNWAPKFYHQMSDIKCISQDSPWSCSDCQYCHFCGFCIDLKIQKENFYFRTFVLQKNPKLMTNFIFVFLTNSLSYGHRIRRYIETRIISGRQ